MANDIIAITSSGRACTRNESFAAFCQAVPGEFVVAIDDRKTILDPRLMSYGTTGKVVGFDTSSKGTLLVLVKWHKDAAPLRVRIEALIPKPPAKFWMVIPLNTDRRNQNMVYEGSTRRQGAAPAVHRFNSRAAAVEYIAGERRATRFNNYVILESMEYHQGDVVIPM